MSDSRAMSAADLNLERRSRLPAMAACACSRIQRRDQVFARPSASSLLAMTSKHCQGCMQVYTVRHADITSEFRTIDLPDLDQR
jgi:hypothetical protein